MRWLLILSLALTPLLASCAKTTATAETSCLVWRPISWSKKDTDQTIEEVKAHNARRKAYCEEQ